MTQSLKQWLVAVPWESVLALNKALCQAQKMTPLNNARGLEPARCLWEKSVSRSMTLNEACEVCHKCQQLGPFTFNNGNTFAAIGRTFVEDDLKLMPPVEAQIIRTTIGHYIVGLIGRRELEQVLRHFAPSLDRVSRNDSVAALAPAAVARPQEQRAPA